MVDKQHWAVGSDQYVKRLKRDAPSAVPEVSLPSPRPDRPDRQREATGIHWDRNTIDWDLLTPSTVERVRARYRAVLPEYIWDAARLEGNPYTLPEVQTLLEGITVNGHTLEDQHQILALNDAYNTLDRLVGTGTFHLDKATSDLLHGQVAVHEAVESGHFRGEGQAGGGGLVGLGSLGTYQASSPGEAGATLITEHRLLLEYLADVPDPREQALVFFCAAVRRQFYFDGNKRTARLMMIGQLMSHGFDAISVSARRRLEFNTHLSELFDTGDATTMMRFLIDSRPAQ
ncbi:MAG: Fic family protein [Microbacteriaceae bacterium]